MEAAGRFTRALRQSYVFKKDKMQVTSLANYRYCCNNYGNKMSDAKGKWTIS